MKNEDILRIARSALRFTINDNDMPEFCSAKATIWDREFLVRFAHGVMNATQHSERKLIADWVRDMCQGLDANAIADGIENGGNDAVDNFKVTK